MNQSFNTSNYMKRLLLPLAFLSVFSLLAVADDFDIMRQNLRDYLVLGDMNYNPQDPQMRSYITSLNNRAAAYQKSMRHDTTVLWNDLRLIHDVPSYTPPQLNSTYSRLLEMARAWAYPGGALYQNEQLKEDIRFGLEVLYKGAYNKKTVKIGSWWEWRIGIPWTYAHIVSILYEHLTPEEINHYEEGVARFIRSFTKHGDLTWANKASICRNLLLLGILTNNEQDVRDALRYVVPAFVDETTPQQRMSTIRKQDSYVSRQKSPYSVRVLEKKEGLYQDGTFIQHTCIPYIGTYGLEIIQMSGYMNRLLAGSSYQVPQEIVDVLPVWINHTYLPAIYHGEMALMLMGRANASDPYYNARMVALSVLESADLITDSVQRANANTAAANIVAYNEHYASPYAGLTPLPVYKPIVDRALALASEPTDDMPFSIVWAAGDKVIHQTDKWRVCLSMSSNRIGKYESFLTPTAKQNNTGWYTGDGMTYLYIPNDLQQYYQYMLNINPYKVPGTTVDLIERKEEATVSPMYGNPANAPRLARAGGVTDGQYSSAMMQLVGGASGLTAKKSWFFFENEVVCLGADINLDAEREVITTIENRRQRHPLNLSDNQRLQRFDNQVVTHSVRWAQLETVGGYYFPDTAIISLCQTDKGNTEIWMSHGTAPQKSTYAYYLLPTMTEQEVAAYAAEPAVQIVENSPQIQAVSKDEDNVLAVNFWTAATLQTDKLSITSDGVAALMLRAENDSLILSIVDPTWELRKQTITLDGNWQLLSEGKGITLKQKNAKTTLSFKQTNSLGQPQRVMLQRRE